MTEKKTIVDKEPIGVVCELSIERRESPSMGAPAVESWRVRVAGAGPFPEDVRLSLPPEIGRALNAAMLDSEVDLVVHLSVEAVPKP